MKYKKFYPIDKRIEMFDSEHVNFPKCYRYIVSTINGSMVDIIFDNMHQNKIKIDVLINSYNKSEVIFRKFRNGIACNLYRYNNELDLMR